MVFNILSPTCFVRIVDKKLKGVLLLNSYIGMSNRLIDIKTMSVPEDEIDYVQYKQKIDEYLKKSYNYIDKIVGSNEKYYI